MNYDCRDSHTCLYLVRSVAVAATLAVLAIAGPSCDNTQTTTCENGLICPENWTCAARQNICIDTTCGNAVLDPGELCDDGNVQDGDNCTADCQSLPGCGNSVLEGAEVCDDGNKESGDGCSAD